MWLFSATIPYFSTILATAFYEMMSDPLIGICFIGCVLLSVLSLVGYFLCWLFSKKHTGWMVAALVMFSLDTLLGIGLYVFIHDATGILDVLIHIWVLYYLISGVINGFRLKKQSDTPEDNPPVYYDPSAYTPPSDTL